jgi:hypothetical protein
MTLEMVDFHALSVCGKTNGKNQWENHDDGDYRW